MILTLGRSGSNTLVDMLNQHPSILNYGEVLGEWTLLYRIRNKLGLLPKDNSRFLDALHSRATIAYLANGWRSLGKVMKGRFNEIKRTRDIRTIGVKEFAFNLRRFNLDTYIAQRPQFKIIGLTRKNILARAVSAARLEATGIVSSRTAPTKIAVENLYLPPDRMIELLETAENEARELELMLQTAGEHRVLRLDYEALYSDPETTLNAVRRVHKFLKLPVHVPQIRMKKIGKADPLEAFRNADELRQAISQTRFAIWLRADKLGPDDAHKATAALGQVA